MKLALKPMTAFVLFSCSYFNSRSLKFWLFLGRIAGHAPLQPAGTAAGAGLPGGNHTGDFQVLGLFPL